jgi:hypothetical protein
MRATLTGAVHPAGSDGNSSRDRVLEVYNVMHTAMAVPIEDPVKGYTDWVNYRKRPGEI